ncbi:MAG: helix-turn-helix domain-containing protein [Desulfobacterales bacterium]
MISKKNRVSSGISQLDNLLGGLFIGDNVIWYDVAGSLASAFCMNFIQASQMQNKPFIYVSFDRSPKNLLEKLGPLAENQHLTILDCFTHGKGDGSEIFSKFYEKNGARWPYQIIKVNEPWKPEKVIESVYGLHKTMKGDVRFVFESLTGMQDLWQGEDSILKFYSHSCPRLYELDTIAYWIVEKGAHSDRLKAHINQIAQVAIDLSVKRGKSALTIIKAEKRRPDTLNKEISFWSDGMMISFDSGRGAPGKIDIGMRLKELRTRQGLSQKELAKHVGVTPSTISQVESNSIYPSLQALFKIAETLSVEVSSFFQKKTDLKNRTVFSAGKAVKTAFPDLPKGSIRGELLTPIDFDMKAEPYLIEIPPKKSLPSHFFIHKGDEIGYVLSGKLQTKINNSTYKVGAGDTIYLTSEMPTQWKNPGPGTAKLFWVKIK